MKIKITFKSHSLDFIWTIISALMKKCGNFFKLNEAQHFDNE
jgi:hypothetical protein